MQKKRLVLLMILGMFVLGLASCAVVPLKWEEATKIVPLPNDIKIISPSPDLPREIAAFSGQWIGTWGGFLNSILVVEEITEKEAKIVYAWEAYKAPPPVLSAKAGYKRFVAKVILSAGPEIEFGSGGGSVKFRFEMQKDYKTLKAIREYYRGEWDRRDLGTFKRPD